MCLLPSPSFETLSVVDLNQRQSSRPSQKKKKENNTTTVCLSPVRSWLAVCLLFCFSEQSSPLSSVSLSLYLSSFYLFILLKLDSSELSISHSKNLVYLLDPSNVEQLCCLFFGARASAPGSRRLTSRFGLGQCPFCSGHQFSDPNRTRLTQSLTKIKIKFARTPKNQADCHSVLFCARGRSRVVVTFARQLSVCLIHLSFIIFHLLSGE